MTFSVIIIDIDWYEKNYRDFFFLAISPSSTFKWTNSNGKEIFSDYVIHMKHKCRRLHLLNRKHSKALVYQIIKMLMQSPYCFSLTHSQSLHLPVCRGKLYACAWALIKLCRQLKARYNDLNGILINVWLVD